MFKGDPKDKSIYLHFAENHFDLIVSMSGFLNRGNFCNLCGRGYVRKLKLPSCDSVTEIIYLRNTEYFLGNTEFNDNLSWKLGIQ